MNVVRQVVCEDYGRYNTVARAGFAVYSYRWTSDVHGRDGSRMWLSRLNEVRVTGTRVIVVPRKRR